MTEERESLYAKLPESDRRLLEKHLRKHLLRTLSPSEVERDFPRYLAANRERLARGFHQLNGEEMIAAALKDET